MMAPFKSHQKFTINKKAIASLELVLAGALWGFGFIAAKWALAQFTAYEISFLRFFIPSSLFLLLSIGIKKLRISKIEWRLSALPGLFLTGVLVPQTIGLNYTSATKSGFITTLYVLIVPFLEWILINRKPTRFLLVALVIAILGTALIVELNLDSWNIGDTLTLICAFFAALHIFTVDGVAKTPEVRAFQLNMAQAIWISLFSFFAILSFDTEPVVRINSTLSWVGLFSLAFGSSLIAFFLQFKAQRDLSPTVSSILFLLESPFALLFAVLLLNEAVSPMMNAGAFLIILACLLVTIPLKK